VLRNALKKAVRNRLVPYNVAAESDAPKVGRGIWNPEMKKMEDARPSTAPRCASCSKV
jgi:hypothetical protein